MHACLFNYPGVGLVDLHIPGLARSEVIDLNDSWILIHAYPSSEDAAYLIRIGEPWTRVKAFRRIPGSNIIPQARAFSWDERTGIVRDISPSNAYAEAYEINDAGKVVGYSGFTDERCGAYNRAILTESMAGPQLAKWE